MMNQLHKIQLVALKCERLIKKHVLIGYQTLHICEMFKFEAMSGNISHEQPLKCTGDK